MSKTTLWLGLLLLVNMACGEAGDGLVPINVAGSPGSFGGAGAATAGDTSATSGTAGVAPVTTHCPNEAFPIGGGVCRCVSELPDVCDDTCTDRTSDPENCGSCGKLCAPGSTCVNGACGPTPNTVLPSRADCGALHLALGGGYLFWSDPAQGQVMIMPTPAGAAVPLARNQDTPTLLALFGETLFWLNSGTNTIMKASVPGGAPNAVYKNLTEIHGFTVSPEGSTLYFSSENHVFKIPVEGGVALDVVDQDFDGKPSGVPYALAIDGDVLTYLVDRDGSVNAISLAAQQPALCDDADLGAPLCRLTRAYGLVLDTLFALNGRAYWADNVEGAIASSLTVSDQFTRQDVATPSNHEQLTALTIQGGSAFFAAGGDIYTAPLLQNSSSIPVARDRAPVNSLAADGANLYWSTWQAPISAGQGAANGGQTGTCGIERIAY